MEGYLNEIMLENTNCYFSSTMSLCNLQKHHGLFVCKINNQFVKIVSGLIEEICVFGNSYNLSFHRFAKAIIHEGNNYQHCPVIEERSYKTCYSMGPIFLEKEIILDKHESKISVFYTLKETCSDIILKIKPLFALTNIFHLSKIRNIRNLNIQNVNNNVHFKTTENSINLTISVNKKYSLEISENWMPDFEYTYIKSKSYEDLFTPLDFTINLKKNEKIEIVFAHSDQLDESIEDLYYEDELFSN